MAQVKGSLFMDVPEHIKKHGTISDLGLKAQDRDEWRALVSALAPQIKNE